MRRRPRVLFVVPSLSQGGSERQIVELLKRLGADGQETALCTLRDDNHYGPLLPPGEPRFRLRRPGALSAGALRDLVGVVREFRPDVVHTFMDQANLWARLAAPLGGAPAVITSVRGPWMRWRYLAVEGLLARTVGAAVVVNGRSTYDEMLRWARVPAARLRIIHNFVDFDAFRPGTEAERAAARTRFGLAADEVALLLPGRVAPQKHHLGLALALGRLRSRGSLPPTTRILLAGRERDAWYARLVAPALRAAGVDHLVRRLGVVPPARMRELYLAADVLLLPSLWEGLPNVLLEAHACGRPAVVTDRADTDGVVVNGVTGFVAPLEAAMGRFADALAGIVAQSPARRAAMGEAAATHVRRAFDPARVMGEYRELYAAVLGS